MRAFIYLFIDSKKELFHVGASSDLTRTIEFYTSIPMTQENYRRYILVWCCECPSLEVAQEKSKQLKAYPDEKKRAIIEKTNPSYTELKLGKNFKI